MKTYNSNEVSIIFANLSLDSGRAEGEFVSTEFTSEAYTDTAGADGEVTVNKSNDERGTITVKLLGSSSGHKILTQLYAAARTARNGRFAAPLQIRDRNGGLVEHAENAWIAKAPTNAFGKEVGEREWTIKTDKLVREVE